MKLCSDCKFFVKEQFGSPTCGKSFGINPVDGKPKLHQWKYCSILRSDWRWHPFALLTKCCTRGARYFEPKQPANGPGK